MPTTFDMFFPEAPAGKTPPTVTYRPEAFDSEQQISFNILREVPNQRCYFCHSNVYYESQHTEKWSSDEDIHLTAGLKCVDCHRNGIDHKTTRGYPSETADPNDHFAVLSSCEGCHLGSHSADIPGAGRLGAPIPKHVGIPVVHFERLTCTACHSGPWPGKKTILAKTARAHRLGTPNVNKSEEMLPHIVAPVLAKQADGKLAPHKMVWPSYWCTIEDQNIAPIAYDTVTNIVGSAFESKELLASGNWPEFTKGDIKAALTALTSDGELEGKVGYVTGGNLYSLDESGELVEQPNHPSAKPYLWPIGHDVRPAAQSLGIRYCTDCHATDAPFFFGDVMVDSTITTDRANIKRMTDFQDISPTYAWAFAASFVFRPWFKVVALGSCALLAVVLLLYALKALACVVKILTQRD